MLDYLDYANLAANRSYGSFPDGQSFARQEFFHATPGQANDGARFNTNVAGFTNSNIKITIDGVTTSSLLDNQGMFSIITPRLDAVEEVSLTTASAGADASGGGAVQVRVATRSGTNKFQLSLYWYQQHANFNSNTFFNRLAGLPVPTATNYTYGGRVGGPIILPGFDGRGRAFFFFNQEEVYGPIETARARTIISQPALNGDFGYGTTTINTVNVLALAAANGQIATYDPTIKALIIPIKMVYGATNGNMTFDPMVDTVPGGSTASIAPPVSRNTSSNLLNVQMKRSRNSVPNTALNWGRVI